MREHLHDIQLIWNLTKMQLRDRYLGSALGLAWAVIQPLCFLGMYTFVFGFIFKSKAPGAETTLSYVIWLISGLVPFLTVSDAISATANSVVGGSSLVKNIVFKCEALPIAAALASFLPFVVGMLFLAILLVVDGQTPSWHIVALPVIILLQFLFLCGLGFFLGATTVFLRDLTHALPTAITLLLFFTPIFYSMEMMPIIVQRVTFFNPLYQMTRPYRDVLLAHQLPEAKGLAYLALLSCLLFWLGLRYFRRLKGYFESAL